MTTKTTTATDPTTTKATTKAAPKTRKPRAPKATSATVKLPEPPKCSCGKVLDWRDRTYGKGGQCKRCTERTAKVRARGTFTAAATYCAVLASRQHVKARKHHQTATRDLPARMQAERLARRKAGKVA